METPKWVLDLKPGDTLIAIDPCTMNRGGGDALVVGKPYNIIKVSNTGITLKSEISGCHGFDHDDIVASFKINQSFLREIQDTKPTFEEVRKRIRKSRDRGYNAVILTKVSEAEIHYLQSEGFTCKEDRKGGFWLVSWK